MKRRTFLLGALAAPVTAAAPAIPMPKVGPYPNAYAISQMLQEAMFKIVNPPIVIENITGAYLGQYRAEVIGNFENHMSLLRDVATYGQGMAKITIKP